MGRVSAGASLVSPRMTPFSLPRTTCQEVPTAASPYVDSALKPLRQLQSEQGARLTQATLQRWLQDALSASTRR